MEILLVILNLAGGVALFLWAIRMVRTGVERAYGPALERLLKGARGGGLSRVAIGMMAAMLMQSGSAVAVLSAGFVASGVLAAGAALALVLGADLGSALIVQVLSLDLAWLMPILFVTGGWMFLNGRSREIRQGGRILVGIGLVLVSLQLIALATDPLRQSEVLPAVVTYLGGDRVACFLLGAVCAFALHSSIATLLLVASMVAQQILSVEPAIAIVLGANFGGALIPVALTRTAMPAARRIPIGNLLFRAVGSVSALVLLGLLVPVADLLVMPAAQKVVLAHVAFNVVFVAVFLPFTNAVQPALQAIIREPESSASNGDLRAVRVSQLDRSVLHTPRLALASTTRELLHAGEVVELMLRPLMELFEAGSKERIKEMRFLAVEASLVHSDIKDYLVELNRGAMDSVDAHRSMELANFSINLQHAGDIVATNLLKLIDEMRAKRLSFSDEGRLELLEQHALLMANLQLALNVLVSGDRESARDLIAEKDRMRELALRSQDSHLKRLQDGSVRSAETSKFHLETIRALRQINSLLASVAYPILAEAGELLDSRLAEAG